MKFLVLGNFGIGSLENEYCKNLKLLGHQVIALEIDTNSNFICHNRVLNRLLTEINLDLAYKKLNSAVIDFTESLFYDVILIFKGQFLTPATIAAIKCKTKLLVNYNPDHPIEFHSRGSGNMNIFNSLDIYDIIFTYSDNIAKKLRTLYDINAYTIPFGFRSLSKNDFIKTDFSRVSFVGAYDKSRYSTMRNIRELNLQIYGDVKWSILNSFFKANNVYMKGKLYGDELNDFIKSSGINLNLLRHQNLSENSHNMRTFEIPSVSGFMIAHFTDEQANFFEPNKEAVYFSNIEELNEKISFYRSKEGAVKSIAKAAYRRSKLSSYSYLDRVITMLSIIKNHL